MYGVIREIENAMEKQQFQTLLHREGLKADPGLDYLCGIFDQEEELLGCAGCAGNTVRCLAVREDQQGEGLLGQLMAHLLQVQLRRGNRRVFLYTKPETAEKMKSLGFYEVARSDRAVFLENQKNGFENYCSGLEKLPGQSIAAIVMNANPLTLGHLHLVRQAALENDWVHVFLLSQEAGPIPAELRIRLARQELGAISNVVIHETDSYLISSATFPSYFLKDSDQAIREQAELDLQIFKRLAERLEISSRYAGQEPFSHVTACYNQLMAEKLPQAGIRFREIPRLEAAGRVVSASAVRQAIREGRLGEVRDFLPQGVYSYFASPAGEEVCRRIRAEENVIHY